MLHFSRLSIAALALVSSISFSVSAQKKPVSTAIEDLPKIPIDTVETVDPDTRIILYTNNTWSYYRPDMHHYDELPCYSSHWERSQIFAYRSIEHKDLPDVVNLSLVGNVSEYHPPVVGPVRSKYGIRRRRNHNGVDISMPIGTPIYATFDGKVRYTRYNTGGYGNLVIIRHRNGLETWYAHLVKSNVNEDDYVKAGQVIGFMGSTGRSTGSHLHFEFRYYDQVFDPEFLIDFPTGELKANTFALHKSYLNINSRASEMLIEDDDEFGEGSLLDPDLHILADMGDSAAMNILASQEYARKQAELKAKEEAKKAVYHTVKSGDMLGRIAQRYGVTVTQICKLNNITTRTLLRPGKRLRVK